MKHSPRRFAQRWFSPAGCLLGLVLFAWTGLSAGGSSTNYFVPCQVLDAGGAHAASANYFHEGSLGGMTGTAASPSQTFGAGFLAQIEGVTASFPTDFSLLGQPSDVKVVKGSAAFLTLSTTANESDSVQTSYSLVGTTADGFTSSVVVSGLVPSTGILSLPLQSISDSSSSFEVQFIRSYPDGSTLTAQTRKFTVTLRAWTESAGTYTALLDDANSPGTLADGASARGVLTVIVSKSGAFSGRIVYVEAAALSGAPSAGMRFYVPVTRVFTGRFLPASADPSKLVSSCNLGSGTQANRQALSVEVDFSTTKPTLNASVTDTISAPPGVCVSRAELCVPATGSVPSDAPGRYVLSANSAASNNAYTLVQVLGSGRILWTTRLPGYTGSGSVGLVVENGTKLTAPFFESRVLASNTLLNSTTLLGGLNLNFSADSGWGASFGRGAVSDKFEKQSSYLPGTKVSGVFFPVYSGVPYSTGAGVLNFSGRDYCPWASTALATLFPASSTCLLTVNDTLSDASAPVFRWLVTVSSVGFVKTIGVPVEGVYPPSLALRLNSSRGEWTGYYSSNNVRRALVGSALNLQTVRGSGWVETGSSLAPSTARWQMALQ